MNTKYIYELKKNKYFKLIDDLDYHLFYKTKLSKCYRIKLLKIKPDSDVNTDWHLEKI